MPYTVSMITAQIDFPSYNFVSPMTPSEQKAAFHVRDANGHDLCLKIIAPNYRIDRLEREIEALQSITHPNVVALVEYTFSSKQGGQQKHYIIEEFVAGHDLSQELQAGNQWTTAKVKAFFGPLCDGLNAMHEKKLFIEI